jgi:FlaG/FlaF family flagellin (archaellin)
MMKSIQKRGVSLWISWVLIIALMAILAVIVIGWMNDFTISSTDRIKQVYDTTECNYVSVSIDSVCQNTQTLNMNVTNLKNIDVDKIIFRIYDIYGNPDVKEVDTLIRHGSSNTEKLEIIKQGVTDRLEAVPVIIQEKRKVICEKRQVSVESISFC